MPEYRSKRGHYLLSVKDNQPTLKQDIADLWEEDMPPQAAFLKITTSMILNKPESGRFGYWKGNKRRAGPTTKSICWRLMARATS